MAEGIK